MPTTSAIGTHRTSRGVRIVQITAALAGRIAQVERVEVREEADAVRWGMTGSPTILLDGIDPFAVVGAVPSLSCRTYRDRDGKGDGAPSLAALSKALYGRPSLAVLQASTSRTTGVGSEVPAHAGAPDGERDVVGGGEARVFVAGVLAGQPGCKTTGPALVAGGCEGVGGQGAQVVCGGPADQADQADQAAGCDVDHGGQLKPVLPVSM
ncbi:hypothetical protein [Streptomyces sp. ISL-86]|uniref:hypothetical protein n=1 Tax=Streptomyces sp. ISL-86 TaxID=2819187 RepID=UPI001BE85B54|nr:hypothetical protein [Streptomyces sp. ISL-86]MBT2455000.1 hypothetical protein [Streptomyces sp. ISL-86]